MITRKYETVFDISYR